MLRSLQKRQTTFKRASAVDIGGVAQCLVFGWRTFPDICLTGWQVTTLWVNCPLWVSQLGQLSLPSLCGR